MEILESKRAVSAPKITVPGREVGLEIGRNGTDARPVHFERPKDILVQIFFERDAGNCLDGLGGQRYSVRRIAEQLARRSSPNQATFKKLPERDDFIRAGRLPSQIDFIKARRMSQQVSKGDWPGVSV